jgi:hypothetical protein
MQTEFRLPAHPFGVAQKGALPRQISHVPDGSNAGIIFLDQKGWFIEVHKIFVES